MNPFDSNENIYSNVGSIADDGVLRNLNRKGFTLDQCLSELVANSIGINMIDDGVGLTTDGGDNMFKIYNDNQKGLKKIGVSGVGAKAALMLLSEQKEVKIYTKSVTGRYYSIF